MVIYIIYIIFFIKMKKILSKLKILLYKLFGTYIYDEYRSVEIGSTQGWYGRVNFWATSKKILTKELNSIVKNGLNGYLIELNVWTGLDGSNKHEWNDKWISEISSMYKWLLEECRKRKIWLFVSIINDNMGKGKYGDTGPTLAKVYDYAIKLVKTVKTNGNKGVYVQPVAETQTTAGKKFEQYCISELQGFNLVYNGNGGYPTKPIAGMQHYAVHPSKISIQNPSDAFVVSDHGLIIRELNIDNSLTTHGDITKVTIWANNVRNRNSPVCAYYAFQISDYDGDTIKALGKVLKK